MIIDGDKFQKDFQNQQKKDKIINILLPLFGLILGFVGLKYENVFSYFFIITAVFILYKIISFIKLTKSIELKTFFKWLLIFSILIMSILLIFIPLLKILLLTFFIFLMYQKVKFSNHSFFLGDLINLIIMAILIVLAFTFYKEKLIFPIITIIASSYFLVKNIINTFK